MPQVVAARPRLFAEEAEHVRIDGFVLDPYAGAGTTLLAAQRLRRRWVGIEIKRSFVELIDRRLQ